MDTLTDVLLVTANVGSLFDDIDDFQNRWLEEFFKTIRKHNALFIALHFQEVGGKDFKRNMDKAEIFIGNIQSSEELKSYDRSCVYVDTDHKTDDHFTALGSMYFIHKKLKNVSQYDFKYKDFFPACEHETYVGSLDDVTTMEKEKFPKSFWPDVIWSRKGFMRTRWLIQNQSFDFVNIHLFHDASNVVAVRSSPSEYSFTRKNALDYVFKRIFDSSYPFMPFFLFGDFNFRLDTCSLVEYLINEKRVLSDTVDEDFDYDKIVYTERGNHPEILLQIENRRFRHEQLAIFTEDNGRELLKFDREVTPFKDYIWEEDIRFPPTYPYKEDRSEPDKYERTRCPAWCDRIFVSHNANKFINRSDDDGKSVVYDTIGQNVCMGDHKPVFLSFQLKTNKH